MWSETIMARPFAHGKRAVALEPTLAERVQRDGPPSAALLDALLVAVTNDVTALVSNHRARRAHRAAPPEPIGAWTGRVAVDDAPARAVATGELRAYEARVVDRLTPLTITLVWKERAGRAFENELALRVRHPASGTGWAATGHDAVPGHVRRVLIAAPPLGRYIVEVEGVKVVRDADARQDYALVVTNAEGLLEVRAGG
jgi:hypothetical protein